MKTTLLTTTIALAFAIGAWASPWNKKTVIDVKETILIPGKELPPGKYVMKLADSASNRHIVQIFNSDETKVEATILAIPNWRLKPTGKTALGYWETPSGVPPALRSWFYPGDNFGQEFAYPKTIAARLASLNNAKVPWYEGNDQADYEKSTLDQAKIYDYEQEPPPPTVAANPPVSQPETRTSATQSAANSVAAAPEQPRQEEQLIAQNRAPAPDPTENRDTLPDTATSYAAFLLGGLALFALGCLATARRRLS
ncbi:MAG: hypothetical protein JJE04_24710 [Acidobacteriia bacterium]|nr:hypothetical protein [Terriglobia bacterium]